VASGQALSWSGPLPDPPEPDAHHGVFEGGADRVTQMVERQAEHRQYVEWRSVDADIGLRMVGLVGALPLPTGRVLTQALTPRLDRRPGTRCRRAACRSPAGTTA
jgi:hypothetical protein